VIDNFVRHESTCPVSLRRHFKAIDETICEELLWQRGSPIFALLEQAAKETSNANDHTAPSTSELFPAAAAAGGGEGGSAGEGEQVPSPAVAESGGSAQKSRDFFMKKVLYFAARRVQELCHELQASCGGLEVSSTVVQQVWTALKHCLNEHVDLLLGRHLDQVLLCTLYGVAKNNHLPYLFKDIIEAYKKQGQSRPEIYRSVRIDLEIPAQGEQGVTYIERDGIINFYNRIFLPCMKHFLLQKRQAEDSKDAMPPLSPNQLMPPPQSPVTTTAQGNYSQGAMGAGYSPVPKIGKQASARPSPSMALVAVGESPMQEFAQINSRLRAQRRARPSMERLSFDGDTDGRAGAGPSLGSQEAPGAGTKRRRHDGGLSLGEL